MMKKHIVLLTISILIHFHCRSQIAFEKGYLVNESDEKIECLIKNVDWKNNPTSFNYKLTDNTEVKKGDIQSVKEFGVNNSYKYQRATVNIDRSSDELKDISIAKSPEFKEEQLFLKVLVEGEASLYQYEDGLLIRFFYKTTDPEIKQLVYKSYRTDDNRIGKNNHFRQQLFNDLKCEEIPKQYAQSIEYNKKELEKYFVRYNECHKSSYVSYTITKKRDFLNLTVRPGADLSSLSVFGFSGHITQLDFGNKINARLGIEAEFILPFNKNKWGILVEPCYHNFQSERVTETPNAFGGRLVSIVNYQTIDLFVGLRHYFFLSDNSSIFVNLAGKILEKNFDSAIEIRRADGTLYESYVIKSARLNYAMGLGFKYKNRYSLEMRHQTKKDILGNYILAYSEFSSTSVILGIKLF